MSTKTIALDSRVYRRLAGAKREGESFSKTIDRLLQEVGSVYTAKDVLRGLEDLPLLSADDAATMLRAIDENRRETWEAHDLR